MVGYFTAVNMQASIHQRTQIHCTVSIRESFHTIYKTNAVFGLDLSVLSRYKNLRTYVSILRV